MLSRYKQFFISNLGVYFLAFFVVMLIAAADAGRDGIQITRIFGTVQVLREGHTSWSRANERQVLRTGDRLRTGENGWCYLELHEGNIIKVLKNSTVVLDSVKQTIERVSGRILFAYRGVGSYNVRLEEGHVVPVLERFTGSSMSLSTPVATAGVRGTIFEAEVEKVGGTAASSGEASYNVNFTVHKGEIAVTDLSNPTAGATMVPAGFQLGFRNVHVPTGGFGNQQQRQGQGMPSQPGQPGQGGHGPGNQQQGQPGQPGQGNQTSGQQLGQPGQGRPGQPEQGGQMQSGGQGQPNSAGRPISSPTSIGPTSNQPIVGGQNASPSAMPSGPLSNQVQPIGNMQTIRQNNQQPAPNQPGQRGIMNKQVPGIMQPINQIRPPQTMQGGVMQQPLLKPPLPPPDGSTSNTFLPPPPTDTTSHPQ